MSAAEKTVLQIALEEHRPIRPVQRMRPADNLLEGLKKASGGRRYVDREYRDTLLSSRELLCDYRVIVAVQR